MLLRLSLISLLAALVGCVTSDLPAEADAFVEHAGPQLAVDSQTAASVLPNESVALKVRYLDATGRPAAGIPIEFALTGVAPGASLAPWRAVTDADGVAATALLVGSMPGNVEVRAATNVTSSVYMRVQVREALPTQLAVRVAYDGARDVAAYTVTALPQMHCDEALAAAVAGAVVHRFTDGAQVVDFALMPAVDSAIVAWARDDSGAQLARGCAEFSSPVSAAPDARHSELLIALDDTPLRLEGGLALQLHLNLLPSMKRVGALHQAVVRQALAPYAQDAEAAFYTAALSQRLGLPSAAFDGRRASLAARLREQDAGPTALGRQIGELLSQRGAGAQLRLRGALGASASIDSLEALATDGATTLALGLRPDLALSTTLDHDAARLVISQLRLELELGTYAKAMLAGIAASEPSEFAASIDRAAGCSAVMGPWTQQEGLADAATGRAACLAAVQELQARFGVELDMLSRQPLTLSGSLQARDRSEDGSVDDLGPGTLEGSWVAEDRVVGDVRVPTQAVLVL